MVAHVEFSEDGKPSDVAAFNPDGRRLAVAGDDQTLAIWDLSPTDATLDALRFRAELLSGQRVDPQRGLTPLEPADLQTHFDRLAGK